MVGMQVTVQNHGVFRSQYVDLVILHWHQIAGGVHRRD